MKRLDETGLHHIDCDCARCEAGFRPTMRERWVARRALDDLRRRALAAKTAASAPAATPSVAARIASSRLSIAADIAETDRKLAELRQVVVPVDPRTAVFRALRARGVSMEDAFAEVERQFGPEPTNQEENDDGHWND